MKAILYSCRNMILLTNGNNIVDPGEVLLRSTNPGLQPDKISVVGAGNYFLQAYRTDNANPVDYILTFNPFLTNSQVE